MTLTSVTIHMIISYMYIQSLFLLNRNTEWAAGRKSMSIGSELCRSNNSKKSNRSGEQKA